VNNVRETIGVIGAGAMGAGIAQVAAVAGNRVLLADAVPGLADKAAARIRERVRELVARGRLDADPEALDLTATDIDGLAGARLVVEAVLEDLEVKRGLFAEVEKVVGASCVLASNTSSLSVTAVAAGLQHPERLVGMHFFNPVPVMRLVEIVSGLATEPAAAEHAAALAAAWGKTVVRSSDTPGFIVNRVARPFYAEAWRVAEEQAAPPAVIDAVLTGAGRFRMGPFALMDLIGHDVNEAVTSSVWASLGNDPRFAPSLAQRALVQAGWLGRKAGRGCYDYVGARAPSAPVPAFAERAPQAVVAIGPSPLRPLLDASGVTVITRSRDAVPPVLPGGMVELPSGALLARSQGTTATALQAATGCPVIVVDRTGDDPTAIAIAASDGCPAAAVAEATGVLQAAGLAVYRIDDTPGLIVTRTIAMLANLAADAVSRKVTSAADVDTAMRLGTNYPLGPLAWADLWGAADVVAILDALENWYRDGHYRAAPALRRAALTGGLLSE
jgi:3-hydroxybutyryl-CoA dehydrogenase